MACLGPLLGSHKGMIKVSCQPVLRSPWEKGLPFFFFLQNSDPTTVILNIFISCCLELEGAAFATWAPNTSSP